MSTIESFDINDNDNNNNNNDSGNNLEQYEDIIDVQVIAKMQEESKYSFILFNL